jgi:hypothetical protein
VRGDLGDVVHLEEGTLQEMAWLALGLLLRQGQAPQEHPTWGAQWISTGRIIDQPSIHVGVRPAFCTDGRSPSRLDDWGLGVTMQISL